VHLSPTVFPIIVDSRNLSPIHDIPRHLHAQDKIYVSSKFIDNIYATYNYATRSDKFRNIAFTRRKLIVEKQKCSHVR
jgi:hypothetical protein